MNQKIRKTSKDSDQKWKNKEMPGSFPSQFNYCESSAENTDNGHSVFILLFLSVAFGIIGKSFHKIKYSRYLSIHICW